jgi:hypothetical protein
MSPAMRQLASAFAATALEMNVIPGDEILFASHLLVVLIEWIPLHVIRSTRIASKKGMVSAVI